MLLLRYGAAALTMALPFFSVSFAQTIALDKEDATVWAQDQVISGEIDGATSGILFVDDTPVPFDADAGRFAVPIRIGAGETVVTACAGVTDVCTPPRRLTLGYTPRPEAELRASVAGGSVVLQGEVLDNPTGGPLTFSWSADPDNPAPLALAASGDNTAVVDVPPGAPAGEYYFAWTVRAADGGERTARTFVTVHEDGSVEPFVLEDDHAAWIDRATLYGVAPYYFVRTAPNRFDAVRDKLPEIVELGVNTLWLQPVFASHGGGHSYDTTDYFAVASRLGDEQDLRDLIDTAHGLGLRVIFDIPLNHTSNMHPYAQDAITYGPRSHYFDFYQREFDSAPYARHYNAHSVGEMSFVYYFWDNLFNLNYDNPEVRRHAIEASRYWVENFDIDGYRVDAPWGMDGRTPDFIPEWRAALKRIRPDILLIGEDKASRPDRFDNRYDVAYDWADGEGWVSEWNWQATYSEDSNPTIFNYGSETSRSSRLRNALTNDGRGWHPDAKVLRFLENNDTFRFVQHHSYEQTRMAAALLFSLPGVPTLYMGQEVGHERHPIYEWGTIYTANRSIKSRDPEGLFFPYYQHLLRLREAFPSLHSDTFEEVPVGPIAHSSRVFAYRRWAEDEHVVAAINMGTADRIATLTLPVDDMGLVAEVEYFVTDLISGAVHTATGSELAELRVEVPGHTTVLLAVTAETVELPVSGESPTPEAPDVFALESNYPNPFTSQTTITFSTSQAGPVRLRVLDLLGREVAVLVDDHVPAGRQSVAFDASALANGVYLYVLERGGERLSRRMTLLR